MAEWIRSHHVWLHAARASRAHVRFREAGIADKAVLPLIRNSVAISNWLVLLLTIANVSTAHMWLLVCFLNDAAGCVHYTPATRRGKLGNRISDINGDENKLVVRRMFKFRLENFTLFTVKPIVYSL